jgi:hypothetical protein
MDFQLSKFPDYKITNAFGWFRHLTGGNVPLTISLISLSINHLMERTDSDAGSFL